MVLSNEEVDRVMLDDYEGVLDAHLALEFAGERYCYLQRILRRHHIRDLGAPWGIERWTHKALVRPLANATIPAQWITI